MNNDGGFDTDLAVCAVFWQIVDDVALKGTVDGFLSTVAPER
jgi:hypothetical protein